MNMLYYIDVDSGQGGYKYSIEDISRVMKSMVYCLIFLVPFNSFAQKDSLIENKNEINIELLGSGIPYSVNYERVFYRKSNIEYKGSAGLHFFPFIIVGYTDYRSFSLNIEPKINYYFDRNSVELGIGFTYVYLFDVIFGPKANYCCSDLKLLIPRLGYRRYNRSKTRYWGISFTPLFFLDRKEPGDEYLNNLFIPYGGIRYGWKF